MAVWLQIVVEDIWEAPAGLLTNNSNSNIWSENLGGGCLNSKAGVRLIICASNKIGKERSFIWKLPELICFAGIASGNQVLHHWKRSNAKASIFILFARAYWLPDALQNKPGKYESHKQLKHVVSHQLNPMKPYKQGKMFLRLYRVCFRWAKMWAT